MGHLYYRPSETSVKQIADVKEPPISNSLTGDYTQTRLEKMLHNWIIKLLLTFLSHLQGDLVSSYNFIIYEFITYFGAPCSFYLIIIASI